MNKNIAALPCNSRPDSRPKTIRRSTGLVIANISHSSRYLRVRDYQVIDRHAETTDSGATGHTANEHKVICTINTHTPNMVSPRGVTRRGVHVGQGRRKRFGIGPARDGDE